jgi:hypothetical protein
MITKILHWVGVAAAIALIIVCFMPWVYYADINETFTGFYTFKNNYGKPGKLLLVVGIGGLIFMLMPKVWAKRINLFLSALGVGYAIKTYILYTSCYSAYCPQKLWGIYVMMIATVVLMIASVFPNLRIEEKKI